VEIGASGVNDLSCAGSKKNVKNPLTNNKKYAIIQIQNKERGNDKWLLLTPPL
jgi:hypothetical protein